MLLAYDYRTSRAFWRLIYPAGRTPNGACKTPPLDRFAYNEEDVLSFASEWVTPSFLEVEDGKLHVLAFDRKARRTSKSHEARAWPHHVPAGSLLDLGTGAYVASPEFVFLLTAATHSLVATIAYGDEICGFYSFDPFSEIGMRQRQQLTNIEKLERYLAGAKGLPGYKQAMRAIPHVIERSASPMETTDEMLACLPYRLGGYCLKRPEMNYPVEMTTEAANIAKKSICYIDLCWQEDGIGIEHQGGILHSSYDSFSADRARIGGLKSMKYDIVEMTNAQVKDLQVFESLTLYVASRMGKRVDSSKLGPTPERCELREKLFCWNRLYGREISR